jgi:hypothetical protein
LSERELRQMLDYASWFCERHFAQKGEIAPMWHCVTSSGEQFIEPHPAVPNKDLAVALVRAMFDVRDVVRYVYMGEAWTLSRMIQPEEQELIFRRGLANHPDRVEIVQLQGEDQDYGQMIGQRKIIRPAKGNPYLGPLEMVNELPHIPHGAHIQSEGRMVGMLPVRGTRQ